MLAANHFDCDFSTVCQNLTYIRGCSSRYNGFSIFYKFNCIFIINIIWVAFITKFLFMEGCSDIFVDMMSCYEFLKLKRVRVKIMCPCHFQLKNYLFDKYCYEPNRMHCSFRIFKCIAVFECYKQNRTIAFYLRLLDFKQLPTWKKREKVKLYDSKVKFWKKLEENGGNISQTSRDFNIDTKIIRHWLSQRDLIADSVKNRAINEQG